MPLLKNIRPHCSSVLQCFSGRWQQSHTSPCGLISVTSCQSRCSSGWSGNSHIAITVQNNAVSSIRPFMVPKSMKTDCLRQRNKARIFYRAFCLSLIYEDLKGKYSSSECEEDGFELRFQRYNEHNWAIKFNTLDALSSLCVMHNRIVLVCMPVSIFMHYFATHKKNLPIRKE